MSQLGVVLHVVRIIGVERSCRVENLQQTGVQHGCSDHHFCKTMHKNERNTADTLISSRGCRDYREILSNSIFFL